MVEKVPAGSLHDFHGAHSKPLLMKHCRLNADFILLKHCRFSHRVNNFKIYHDFIDFLIIFRSWFLIRDCLKLEFRYDNKRTVFANKFLARLVCGTKNLILGVKSEGAFVQLIYRDRTNSTMLIRLNIAHVHLTVDVSHGLSSTLSFIRRN